MSTKDKPLEIIGATEYISLEGHENIPAKIDTGADSSSIWASSIDMDKNGVLSFVFFDKKSPFFTGKKIKTKQYVARRVRSSNGDIQVRYRVDLPIKIQDKVLSTTFTLSNRSRNTYPALIGRRAIANKFLVDVSIDNVALPKQKHPFKINDKLKSSPYEFHQKYIERSKP